MIRIEDKRLCCGCSACATVCPVQAIRMLPDAMGFRYPVVDENACIRCGACLEACTFRKDREAGMPAAEAPVSWAARACETAVLEGSSSGGAGFLLMDSFVSQGGVVYGARFDDRFQVIHARAETRRDILPMRTSKYVQSDLGNTFGEVLADLSAGREVLFTGTPCQGAALRALAPDASGLYVADILCNGVPAPAVWAAFLGREEGRRKARITGVLSRDPARGWKDNVCTVTYADGTEHASREWAVLYRKRLMVRPSCANCPYACLPHPSDLTMGDCWGIGRIEPSFAADDRGCSLLLVHTPAGGRLAERIAPRMEMRSVRVEDLPQPSLCGPVAPGAAAPSFERDFLDHGYAYVRRRYVVPSLRERWRMLKWQVKQFLKRNGLWR